MRGILRHYPTRLRDVNCTPGRAARGCIPH